MYLGVRTCEPFSLFRTFCFSGFYCVDLCFLCFTSERRRRWRRQWGELFTDVWEEQVIYLNAIANGVESPDADGSDIKMFKTQVEPRATGEWFHCKVLNILTSFLGTDHRILLSVCCLTFYLFLSGVSTVDRILLSTRPATLLPFSWLLL